MSEKNSRELNRGYLFALTAYVLWGTLPLFWRPLSHIPALAILQYRVIMSFVFSGITLFASSRFYRSRQALTAKLSGKDIFRSLIASILIGINWYTYIWAVLNGYTLDASLGYFLTPLVNVLYGVIFFKERPTTRSVIALIISAVAIVILTVNIGRIPVVALTLAFSFGTYGLVKKKSSTNALTGMVLETAWLFIPAVVLMISSGSYRFLTAGDSTDTILLILAGPVTLTPLLFFASAARRIPFISLGFFQYIGPSLMFLLGWFVFGEEISVLRLIAFILVWVALLLFSTTLFKPSQTKGSQAV